MSETPIRRRLVQVYLPAIHLSVDALVWAVSVPLTTLLRFDFDLDRLVRKGIPSAVIVAVVCQIGFGYAAGLYRRRWRYGTFDEIRVLGATVTFTLNPGGSVIGTATANSSGEASLTFTAPSTVGTYTVTATAPNTCGGGGTTTETTEFEVASEAPLPSSGTESGALLRWAATVLGVGIALVVVTLMRRRSSRTPA